MPASAHNARLGSTRCKYLRQIFLYSIQVANTLLRCKSIDFACSRAGDSEGSMRKVSCLARDFSESPRRQSLGNNPALEMSRQQLGVTIRQHKRWSPSRLLEHVVYLCMYSPRPLQHHLANYVQVASLSHYKNPSTVVTV